MIGLGISPNNSSIIQNVLSSTIAPLAPSYLSAVTSAPYAAYGAQRIVTGYSGPLFQVRRASDSATADIYAQVGGDYPDYTAITTWIGSSSATVAILYDQTGNGRHLVQATVANQPSFDPSRRIGNVAPILFDGQRTTVAGPVAKYLSLSGQSFSRQNISVVDIQQRQVSFSDSIDWLFSDTTSGTIANNYASEYTNTIAQNLTVTGTTIRPGTGTTPFPSNNASTPRSSPDVSIATMGASNLRALLTRGNYYTDTSATVSAQTMPAFVVGRSAGDITSSQVYTYNSRTMRLGMVLYPALSQTDAQTVASSLRTAFSIPTSFDYRIVFSGDSIMEGSGAALNGNTVNWLLQSLTKKAEVFNTGLHGKNMSDMYANRVLFYSALYQSGIPNVIFLEAGVNDIRGGTTGADLYTNSTTPLITYLHGLGYKVVVCTLPTYADITTGLSELTNYNSLVIANTAGADGVLDLASNPVTGSQAAHSDTTLYVDKLHPTTLGHRWIAGAPSGTYANPYTYYYALQQVLEMTP